MEQTNKLSFKYKLLAAIVAIALVILSTVGVFQYFRAKALAQEVENQYVRAFHDLVDYTRDVDVLLKKSLLATDAGQMSATASEIFMQTAAAKACLAQLPTENDHLGQTSKFLSQTGDYTSYLSAKIINNGMVTDEEFNNLTQLSAHATAISDGLAELQSQLYDKNLSLDSVIGLTAHANEDSEENSEPGGLYQLEQNFQDYPSLIYDGPFSEHIEQLEALMLKGKPELAQDRALSIARSFLGAERSGGLAFLSDSNGTIPTYSFSTTREDGSNISIAVTKQGGAVLWMLDSRNVASEKIDTEKAIMLASDFLKQNGFNNMKESYYEKAANTLTINFAYTENNIIMYPDLVKVKVALDDGSIVGFESQGYIMSHTKRNLPEIKITENEARDKVKRHLNIKNVKLAVIPLDSRREVLCYELRGDLNGQNYLIYINAQTGNEERILLLLESDEGYLTM
ncbi:MAG: germination protein YpeB [Clostridia bacterium]|nr:germination protein YpeB [Clostridia bacterium]